MATKRAVRRKPKSKRKWFRASTKTGWRKDMSMAERRRLVLRSHGGSSLSAAQGMQALANVTQDPETKRKAKADAQYFFGRRK